VTHAAFAIRRAFDAFFAKDAPPRGAEDQAMPLSLRPRLAAFAFALALAAVPALAAPGKTLRAFANEGEFLAELGRLKALAASKRTVSYAPSPVAAPAAAPGDGSTPTELDSIVLTASRIADQNPASITNVQTLGVDEGDIVKRQGDFLVVLRRGRIFSVRIGGDRLQPVAMVDAFAPGSNPAGTWYDELLVSERTVIVIGYSYERGGTEIGLFDLATNGKLRHRATYQMRSNDYYSASNYASRLIGNTLVFYTPLAIDLHDPDPAAFWPSLRHWRRGPTPPEFHRILPATRIYRTTADLGVDEGVALHTVSLCDLAAPEMTCRSTAVLGPEGRAFHVSQDSVYVWTTPYDTEAKPDASGVWRIPLDGSAPSGLRASGGPVDQMGFLQRDDVLNVVVGSEADGEGMWRSGSKAGEMALLRIPLDRFGDGSGATRPEDYRILPGLDGNRSAIANRFLGEWLLVGAEDRDPKPGRANPPLLALRYADDNPVQRLQTGHGTERIDMLGTGAVVVGKQGDDLRFTSVRLGTLASVTHDYVQPNARQGDERSHGYFYRPTGDDEGIAALPVLGYDSSGKPESASVLYLRERSLRLQRMGQLASQAHGVRDDNCVVSCVDWYGNARPIFIGERVFALLGYELVEGRVDGDRIGERRRVDFGKHMGRR
jgi:hypothetical protein